MSKILSKISKLVSHADSAAALGNHNEAKAFRDTIRGLCKRHKIKLADIRRHAERHSPISSEVVVTGPRELPKWEVMLFSAVTTHKSCRGLILDNGGLSIAGREKPRREAIRLFRKMVKTCKDLSNDYGSTPGAASPFGRLQYQSDTIILMPRVNRWHMQESFAIGFAEGITQQVMTALYARKEQPAEASEPQAKPVEIRPTDLVLVETPVKDELEEVDEYVAQRMEEAAFEMPGPQVEVPAEEKPIHVHSDSFDAGLLAAQTVEPFFAL